MPAAEHLSAGGATGLGRHPGGLVEKRSAPRGGGGGAGGRDGGRVSGTPPQPDWRHPPPTHLRRALTFGSGWEKVGWRSQEVLGAVPSEWSGVSRSVKTRVLLVERRCGMTWGVGQCRHEDRSGEATTKYTPLTRGNRLLTQEHTNGGCSTSRVLPA